VIRFPRPCLLYSQNLRCSSNRRGRPHVTPRHAQRVLARRPLISAPAWTFSPFPCQRQQIDLGIYICCNHETILAQTSKTIETLLSLLQKADVNIRPPSWPTHVDLIFPSIFIFLLMHSCRMDLRVYPLIGRTPG
jgi:hypothetical protein